MTSKYICRLDPELHSCPYFNRGTLGCSNENRCCFRDEIKKKEPVLKKERWYEKYYR